MAETAIAYHRERAEQERRRANQATDGRSKTVHTELALAHERAAISAGIAFVQCTIDNSFRGS